MTVSLSSYIDCTRCGERVPVEVETLDDVFRAANEFSKVHDCTPKRTRTWWAKRIGMGALHVALIGWNLSAAWLAWSVGSAWFIGGLAVAGLLVGTSLTWDRVYRERP